VSVFDIVGMIVFSYFLLFRVLSVGFSVFGCQYHNTYLITYPK